METSRNTYRHKSQFEEIFSFVLMHEYYLDKLCKDLVIQPTLTTKLLIKNYKLIFVPVNGGFSLVANTENDYNNAVFQDHFDLDFEFKFKNPYFYSFTSLNINPEVRYFLDDNFEKVVHLREDHQVTSETLNRPGIAGIMRLKHTKEHSILPLKGENISKFQARNKVVYLKPRLVKLVFICYTSENNLNQFDGMKIKNEGEFEGKVSFENLELVETASGLITYKFTSKELIPMKSSWNGYFIIEKLNHLGTYRKSLPNPRPQTIKFDPYNNTYISENYVKL